MRKPPTMLDWPDLTGARNFEGLICIGREKARSKQCRTRYLLLDPDTREVYKQLACDVGWMKDDSRTIGILAEGLRDMVHLKVRVKFDRGAPVPQMTGSSLFLYEAGPRDAIWPRYWWQLPYTMDYARGLRTAIHMETLRPDVLVAHVDRRQEAMIQRSMPVFEYVRMVGDLNLYVNDLVNAREKRGGHLVNTD